MYLGFSFLTKRNIIRPTHAELDLSLLSVAYLGFPEFSVSYTPEETRHALLQGRYGFYEYAVACWGFHLTSLGDLTALGEADDEEAKGLAMELKETLEPFLAEHYTE